MRHVKVMNTFYEEDFLGYISSLKVTGVYIDGGCFAGNHTVFFANECPSTFIHAIDADIHFYELFKLNCEENIKEDKYKYISCALMDKQGTVNLGPPLQDPKIECVGVDLDKKFVDNGEVTVRTLDSLFAKSTEPIGFMKLDIEGCELLALKGATEIIEKWKPVIAAEAGKKHEREGLIEFLSPYGYKVIKKFTRGTPLLVFRSE
jgi:FkbM family methyltransferase